MKRIAISMMLFLLLTNDAYSAEECSRGISLDIEMWIAAIWAFLKPLAWIIGTVAEKTENKWDNKIAHKVAKVMSYFGWVVGTFGIGDVPKSVKHRPKIKR